MDPRLSSSTAGRPDSGAAAPLTIPGPWLGFPEGDFETRPVYAATLAERDRHDEHAREATDGECRFVWISVPLAAAASTMYEALVDVRLFLRGFGRSDPSLSSRKRTLQMIDAALAATEER